MEETARPAKPPPRGAAGTPDGEPAGTVARTVAAPVVVARIVVAALLVGLLFAVRPAAARADEVTVAVAANFLKPLSALAAPFAETSGHQLRITSASTGTLYAQIRNGAPFDVFLAADRKRPARLEAEGDAVPGSRFTYAVGTLVLWSADPDLLKGAGLDALREGRFRHLAMANPDLAPYGAAARQTLRALGLWDAVAGKLVQGKNVGQTYQLVATRNADLGFVALSQLHRPGPAAGSRWVVPARLHDPIRQDAVLLTRAAEKPAAATFLAFLRGESARRVIEAFGYRAAGAQ